MGSRGLYKVKHSGDTGFKAFDFKLSRRRFQANQIKTRSVLSRTPRLELLLDGREASSCRRYCSHADSNSLLLSIDNNLHDPEYSHWATIIPGVQVRRVRQE